MKTAAYALAAALLLALAPTAVQADEHDGEPEPGVGWDVEDGQCNWLRYSVDPPHLPAVRVDPDCLGQ